MQPGSSARLNEFTTSARRSFVEHFKALAQGRPVIHLGYCGHANPGDNAISLAEDRILSEAGIKVKVRVTDIDLEVRYDETEALVRANPGLPILFRGGGTINDVYLPTAEGHAAIIEAFRDRPILEAAVGINYSDLDAAARFRRAVADHPDFRILARDDQSHAWASEHLECPVSLVPDAVLTGVPSVYRPPSQGRIGVAVRRDLEASDQRGAPPPGPYIPWKDEPRAWTEPRLIPSRLRRRLTGPSLVTSAVEPFAAKGRLARAVRLLTPFDAIVADRLHIALICIMHGIPVAVVDNSYGKVSAAFRTWRLDELARARLAGDFTEAMDIAGHWVA